MFNTHNPSTSIYNYSSCLTSLNLWRHCPLVAFEANVYINQLLEVRNRRLRRFRDYIILYVFFLLNLSSELWYPSIGS